MLHLYHGPNIESSRSDLNKTLTQLKSEHQGIQVLRLDGEKLAESDLIQNLEAESFLGDEKIIIIENLLCQRPSKRRDKLVSSVLATYSLSHIPCHLLLWESKTVSPTTLKKFQQLKDSRIQEFKLSPTLFKFLDSIYPGNARQCTELLRSTLETEAPDLIFFLLARRIAELLLASSLEPRTLDGVKFDWQRHQLINQAKNWTETSLLEFHRRLAEIDESIKTGASPLDLPTQLDICFSSL